MVCVFLHQIKYNEQNKIIRKVEIQRIAFIITKHHKLNVTEIILNGMI